MKIVIFLLASLFVHTIKVNSMQQQDSAGTARYVDGLLMVDKQRLSLTPEQTVKAKKVLVNYMAKYNALPKTDLNQYKAGIKELDVARIHQYKVFLTTDQYSKLLASYNKLHPTGQIQ